MRASIVNNVMCLQFLEKIKCRLLPYNNERLSVHHPYNISAFGIVHTGDRCLLSYMIYTYRQHKCGNIILSAQIQFPPFFS